MNGMMVQNIYSTIFQLCQHILHVHLHNWNEPHFLINFVSKIAFFFHVNFHVTDFHLVV